MQFFRNYINDEAGVTAIEYALIASLIAMVIVISVTAIGTSLVGVFEQVLAGFPA